MTQDTHQNQVHHPRPSFKQRVSRRIFNSCFATNRSEQLVFMPYGRGIGLPAYLIEDPNIGPKLESAYTPYLFIVRWVLGLPVSLYLCWVATGYDFTSPVKNLIPLLAGLLFLSVCETFMVKKPLEKRLSEHLEGLSETDRVARDFFGDKAPPRLYNVMRYLATICIGALGVLIIGLAIWLESLAFTLIVICTLGVVAIGFAFYLWETSGRELERLRASSSTAPVLNSIDDLKDADA